MVSCPHCGKRFDGPGDNETNNKRHINYCSKTKKSKKRGPSTLITSFYGKTAHIEVSSSEHEMHTEYGITDNVAGGSSDPAGVALCSGRNVDIAGFTDTDITVDIAGSSDANEQLDIGDIGAEENMYCKGYQPNFTGNFFSNFPFQLLPEYSFTVERDRLHDEKCIDINYTLRYPAEENKDLNTWCYMLNYSNAIKTLIQRSENVQFSTQNKYLTHAQLLQKLQSVQQERRDLKFTNYQLLKKTSQLGKTLSLHQRLLVTVSENNVPRLTQLVNIALKRKRSVRYIVDKIKDVVDGVYMARASDDDKDLAFLILKFGGPSLLDSLYRANVLPSTPTAYRMAKKCKKIKSSVTMSQTQCFKENINLDVDEEAMWTFSLKQDETCVTPKLRYDAINNEIVGTCYRHSSNKKLSFDKYEDAIAIQELIAKDEIHVPKECLDTGINSLSNDKPLQIISAFPSCSKDDIQGTISMNTEISNLFKKTTGANLMNFCTDGDGTRRRAFNAMLKHEVPIDSEIGKIVHKLPYIDTEVGQNGETVSFDPKYLAKRLWTSVISGKMKVGDVVITKNDLVGLLTLSPIIQHSAETLVYPKDKQNVPSAVDCLLSFTSVVKSDVVSKIPFRFTSVRKQLGLLADVYAGVLAFFVHTDATIKQQINAFSQSAHVLLQLYRKYGTNLMPAQLYHDIQATFIDAIFCCIKMKIHCPSKPLFFVQNGTDNLERFFGNIRLYSKLGVDTLELINCATAMTTCEEVMTKHPDWKKGSRTMRRLCLDYSNPNDWNSDELHLENVDIIREWKIGMHNENILLLSANEEEVDITNVSKHTSFKKPYGRKVGVSEVAFDWSLVEDEDIMIIINDTDDGDTLCEVNTTNGVEPTVNVDGKFVYKASILKDIMKSPDSLSKDRLRRIQGLTRSQPMPTERMMDGMVLIGDPIIIKYNENIHVASIINIYNGSSQVVDIATEEISGDNVKLNVKVLNLKEVDDGLFWDGSYKSDKEYLILAKNCMLVQPDVCLDPPAGMSKYRFDKQTIMDVGVHLTLSVPCAESTAVLHKCNVCKKRVDLAMMRTHIGKHIIDNLVITEHPDIICGFCGMLCSSNLVQTSRGKNKVYYGKIDTQCSYYYDYGKVGAKPSRNTPCTNRLIHCTLPECKQVIWSYNMMRHFEVKHPDTACDIIITDADITAMKKCK